MPGVKGPLVTNGLAASLEEAVMENAAAAVVGLMLKTEPGVETDCGVLVAANGLKAGVELTLG